MVFLLDTHGLPLGSAIVVTAITIPFWKTASWPWQHLREGPIAAVRCRECVAVSGLSRGACITGVSIDVRVGCLVLGFGLPQVIAFQPDQSHGFVSLDIQAQRPVIGDLK